MSPRPADRVADVLVIGLGATGGLAASRLALAGRDVVALEAGDWHHRPEFALDDVHHIGRNRLGAVKVNDEIPTVRSAAHEQARPSRDHVGLLMMNGVGGSKIHSGNISHRFLPWNFEARSRTVARYGADAIPKNSTLVDWPFGFAELEPYYTAVERHYGMAGRGGNLHGEPTGAGNPFEGPRSADYPSPPLRRSGWNRLTDEAARSLGWHPFETPASIRSEPDGDRMACQYCGFCSWNGCWADAKQTPASVGIPEAVASGNLEIRSGARVLSIDTDDSGAAVGATYRRDGATHTVRARRVVLATYTYENTRLLLLSRSAAHPDGLGNVHGQVGRHFMTHSFVNGYGLFPGADLNTWTGTTAQGTAVSDFDGDNAEHSEFVGGGVMMAGHEFRILLHHRYAPARIPRWGTERKRWLAENMRSIGWMYALPDELPYEHHVLDLDPTHTDRLGLPLIRVTQGLEENERRQYEYLIERMRTWFTAAGATEFWHSPIAPSPVSTHAYGGTRMGADPATSVVDPYGYAHHVRDLVVLGASTFPTSGGVNPTETVEALAWRTTDRMLAEA
ncbi:GMC family oxidoreductase [Pseudonocardia alni]|uniref:GMC family oxidoreductase n=1 Tax=Pseudonocardia alni TaxID=33907 RepID=UPI0033FEAF5A